MSDLMDIIKPQIDGMNEMYRIGYEAGLVEGQRRAWAEIKKDLNKLDLMLKRFFNLHFFFLFF